MVVDTATVVAIALAAEESAVPALPAKGGSLTYSEPWEEAPFLLHEDDTDAELVDEDVVVVKPPLLPNKVAKFRFAEGIDRIVFKSYEIGERVMQWATNITETNGVFESSLIHTRKALIVEFKGIGLVYCPSVEVVVSPPTGGIKTLGSQSGYFDVFGTDTIPTGHQWHQYQEA